jgi:release factor glutamine methyltransferase
MRISTNKYRDIAQYFRNELAARYEKEEIDHFIAWCFEDFVGVKNKAWLLNPDQTVHESDLLKFSFAVKDLKRGRPIQYILGKTSFCGFDFMVSPAVLIPRPETEELVGLVLAESAAHPNSFSILDIGTGSGCIAVSLKKKITRAHVYALDLSPDALAIATANAEKNEVPIRFLQHDILQEDSWTNLPSCTFIVSNPPYVKQSEKASMAQHVLEHEPHLALFVPEEDPLIFYAALAQIGKQKLKAGGKLAVEINEALGIETCILFQKFGYTNVVLKQDLQGKDRFVIASF